MIFVDPETKIVTMDEEEYLTIAKHIKDCEEQINSLMMRMNMVEAKCQT
jgi:negative regulator of replication initiation